MLKEIKKVIYQIALFRVESLSRFTRSIVSMPTSGIVQKRFLKILVEILVVASLDGAHCEDCALVGPLLIRSGLDPVNDNRLDSGCFKTLAIKLEAVGAGGLNHQPNL